MEKKYTVKDVIALKRIVLASRRKFDSEKKVLNRYDYYMLGGIDLNMVTSVAYDMHNNGDITGLELSYIRKYVLYQKNSRIIKGFDNLKSMYFQYGDYVISDSEKKKVYDSLIEKGIKENCIDDQVFSGAMREYAVSAGLVKNKKMVSKVNN